MNFPWRDGNRVELLINGEEYFPRLFQCIAEARREILLETFIIFEDEVGRQLQEALSAAAERGVEVQVTVDGYGTACSARTTWPGSPPPGFACTCSTRARACSACVPTCFAGCTASWW